MQIDFHHAVTYVTARIAGFNHADADIIAYSAQYVDDATSSGVVCFDNNAMYTRISSAYKTIDPKSLLSTESRLVWMPFHFLPGNNGKAAGEDIKGKFIKKIVCIPDSPPAKDMLAATLESKNKPYGLHRLGIAMHVYADTWAHQGFAGVNHEVNDVKEIHEIGDSGVFTDPLQDILSHFLEDTVPPLGHGRAREFPDMPFLSWQYRNGINTKPIQRDNTKLFCEAADAMCKAMQQYRGVPETGIGAADKQIIADNFKNIKDANGNNRHKQWVSKIKNGVFSFGTADITYAEHGTNSWKAKALGTSFDMLQYVYKDDFLFSNWKLFHDALQLHQVTVLHDILPKYGICA
jgi:hypothetical protein